jgi:hypothetical protein
LILLKSSRLVAVESGNPRYSGRMSPLRITGFVLIAAAVLFAAASLWFAVVGGDSHLSLYDVWLKFLPGSLNWVQRTVWAGLWTGVYTIISLPAWAVVGIIGLICVGLGRKKVEE